MGKSTRPITQKKKKKKEEGEGMHN